MHWSYDALENLRAITKGQAPPYRYIPMARAYPKGLWMVSLGGSHRCHMIRTAVMIWTPDGDARLGATAKCGAIYGSVAPYMEPPEESEECDDCLLVGTVSHVMYRFFGAGGVLLYVGYSANFGQRLRHHQTQTKWWPEVVDWKLEFFDTEMAGRAAEQSAIFREAPVHNKMGKPRHLRAVA